MNEESYYSKMVQYYPEKAQFFEWMKFELDGRIYYYGEHFKFPYEDSRTSRLLHNKLSSVKRLFVAKKNTVSRDYKGCILSEAYFSVNSTIEKESGVKVYRFPWHEGANVFAERKLNETIRQLSVLPFNELISDDFCRRVNELFNAIAKFLSTNSIGLVVFPNDLAPLNRIAIDACKSVGVPTAIYLHGLPGRYNPIDDNRADFLCVWGEGIKEQYVKQGVKEEKIILTGHPNYSTIVFPEVKPICLDAPLVLTYSVNGAPSSSNVYLLSDRGISVNYAWAVEKALKSIGVNHAVLRLHPVERPEWYSRYVDMEFYTIDNRSLTESLNQSTIVVGPTSTVSMDAASNGVPYFCFEQEMKYSSPLVPPFDGSETDFPIALSVDELIDNITTGKCMQPSVFKRYISNHYDLSGLISKIKK